MKDVKGVHVELLVVGMRKAGYAPNTVRLVYRLLNQMLGTAVSQDLLRRHPIHPELRKALRVHLRVSKVQGPAGVKAFTDDELRAFLAVTRAEGQLYRLYVTGGARRVTARETRGPAPRRRPGGRSGRTPRPTTPRPPTTWAGAERPAPDPTVTKTGRERAVNVGADLGRVFDAIKAERKERALARAWRPVPPWMFVTSNGTPYSQRNVERDFQRVFTHAGLTTRDLTPHSLRHTFACLHIARGASVKWVQQQLGHASSRTLDVYADWFALQDHAGADAIGAKVLGNERGNARHAAS